MKYYEIINLQDLSGLDYIPAENVKIEFILRYMDGAVNGILLLDGEERLFEAMFSFEEDNYFIPRRYLILEAPKNYLELMKLKLVEDRERVSQGYGYVRSESATKIMNEEPDISECAVLGWTYLPSVD